MSRPDAARPTGVIGRAALLVVALAAASPVQCAGDVARGRAQADACAECHGSGQRLPLAGTPYLAGHPAQFLELQMVLMREGLRDVPQMAPFLKGVTDRDISDIAAYFARETPPRNASPRDPKVYARGAQLAMAMICGNCHGENFRGQKHLPRLAGQREDYLIASMKAYRDNRRTGIDTSMNEAMYRISDRDIEALAHFLSHQ